MLHQQGRITSAVCIQLFTLTLFAFVLISGKAFAYEKPSMWISSEHGFNNYIPVGKPYTVSVSSRSIGWDYFKIYENYVLIYEGYNTSVTRQFADYGHRRYAAVVCDNDDHSRCTGYNDAHQVYIYTAPGDPRNVTINHSLTLGYTGQLSWQKAGGSVAITTYDVWMQRPGSNNFESIVSAYGNIWVTTPALTEYGQYRFKVRACTPEVGCGGSSYTSLTLTPPLPGVPGIPSVDSYVPVNKNYSLSWPTASGIVDHYQLLEDGVEVYRGAATSATLNRSQYGHKRYKVMACNLAGCSAASPEKQIYVYTTPGIPGNLVSNKSTILPGEQVTLSWQSAGGEVPGVVYELYVNSPIASNSRVATLSGHSSVRTPSHVGQYQYRIKACNPGGVGCGSFADTVITVNPHVPGSVSVINVAAQVPYNQSQKISWPAASGVVDTYILYNSSTELYRGSQTSFDYTFSQAGGYALMVQACNKTGCGALSPVKSVTSYAAPGSVTGFSASSNSIILDELVTLSWGPASGEISTTTYNLYETVADQAEKLIVSGHSNRRYIHPLTALGSRSFRVVACNGVAGCGTSASTQINVVPPAIGTPGLPSVESYVPVGKTYTINWPATTGKVDFYELFENGTLLYSGAGRFKEVARHNYGHRKYRVRACYKTNVCGSLSAEKQMYVYAAPGAPSDFRSDKSIIKTGERVQLTWGSAGGEVPGVEYKLYVESPVAANALVATLTDKNSVRVPNHVGQYKYKLQACNPEGVGCGPFTNVVITVDPPLPGQVSSLNLNGLLPYKKMQQINWSTVSGVVDHYILYKDNVEIYRGSNPGYQYSFNTVGLHSLRVKACNKTGCGALSPVKQIRAYGIPGAVNSFNTSASSIALDELVTLNWAAASGEISTTTYNLYETLAGQAEKLIVANHGNRSYVHPLTTLGNRSFRILACNKDTGCGVSVTTQVNVIPPAIGTPGLPSVESYVPVGKTYTINWPATTGKVDFYELFENGTLLYSGAGRFKEVARHNYGHRKYRVRACYKTNVCGSLSAEKQMYVYAAPGAPSNFQADKTAIEVGQPVQLNWDLAGGEVPGVVYKLYVESPIAANALVATLTDKESVRRPNHVGQYKYKLQACNPEGVGCGVFAELVIQVKAPSMAIPDNIQGRKTKMVLGESVVVSWDTVANANKYKLFAISPVAEEFLVAELTENETSRMPQHVGLYKYRVQACDDNNCGDKSPWIEVIVYPAPKLKYIRWVDANNNPVTEVKIGTRVLLEWHIENVDKCYGVNNSTPLPPVSENVLQRFYLPGKQEGKGYCINKAGGRFPAKNSEYLHAVLEVKKLSAPKELSKLTP